MLRSRLDDALKLAKLAGEKAMPYFMADSLAVEIEGNGTPVSIADREAESYVRASLAELYPEEGIIGEEHGAAGNLQRAWIIDPIDGTESFVRGVPLFGSLIAFEEEGEVIVGVAHLPALNETVFAAKGLGAWWIKSGASKAEPAKVSQTKCIEDSIFSFTSQSYFEKAGEVEGLNRMFSAAADSRGWSDCYGHILAATGRVDVAIDASMEIWDCASFRRIIEEAGGVYSTLAGSKSIREGSAISSNPHLIDAVLEQFIRR